MAEAAAASETSLTSTMSCESRLDRARRGEHDALGELYAELAPGVLGYLRGSGARDVEDLAGDVFVAMMGRLSGFVGDEAALRRWVFTIAHHRLVDARRRASRQRLDLVVSQPEAADDPYDRVVARLDESAMVVRALAQLTPDQRNVVLLRSVAHLSVAETAEVLRKRTGAVKTLHRRGLAALARVVSREAVSDAADQARRRRFGAD